MLGIELRTDRAPLPEAPTPGMRPERASAHSVSYRITATPGELAVPVSGNAVLTLVRGEGCAPDGTTMHSGDTIWIAQPGTFIPAADASFLAILTVL